jgi:hypothetical protein
LVALLLTGALSEIWALVNAMQLLTKVLEFNLYIPANVRAYMGYLSNLSEFEPIDPRPIFKAMFGWLYILDKTFSFGLAEEAARRLQKKKGGGRRSNSEEETDEEKLDSENFTEKIGPMLWSFFFFALLAVYIAYKKLRSFCSTKARHEWLKLYYTIFWNVPLRILLEVYLESSTEVLTEVRDGLTWDSTLQITFSIFIFVKLALLLVVPYAMYRFFKRNAYRFRERHFRRRFGDSTDILTHRHDKGSIYFMTFCYKRLLIVMFITFTDKAYLQAMGTTYIVQFCLII